MGDLVARVQIAVADPELAAALAAQIGAAMRAVAAEPRPVLARVHVRSRRRLAARAAELPGAIAMIGVTANNARHLVALVDAARAAGAAGIQLVWDGQGAAARERHVFAALEHARATPAAAPVVLAPDDDPAAALALAIARRTPR